MAEPTVDSIREDTEGLRAELAERRFVALRGQPLEEELEAVYARHPGACSLESIEIVKNAMDRADDEPARRRLGLLLEAQIQGFSSRETRSMDHDIEQRDASPLDLGDLGARRASGLLAAAAVEPEPTVRARWEAALRDHATALEPLLVEKMALELGVARRVGFEGLLDVHEKLGGIDPKPAIAAMWDLLAQTRDMYREVMGWALKKTANTTLADASLADVAYTLSARLAEQEKSFDAADAPALASSFLPALGLDMRAQGRIELTIDRDVTDGPRAFVGAVRIPGRIQLAYRTIGGRPAYGELLGALGRALSLAHRNPAAPLEHRSLGDPSLARAFGRAFRALLHSRDFAKRQLGVANPKQLIQTAVLRALFEARGLAARFLYEIELRKRDTVADRREHFAESMRDALGFRFPPELYLYEVREPLRTLFEVRAMALEAILTKHLTHYFDEDWYRNRRSGRFLRELWGPGTALDSDAVAADLGYEGLPVQPLVELFGRNL